MRGATGSLREPPAQVQQRHVHRRHRGGERPDRGYIRIGKKVTVTDYDIIGNTVRIGAGTSADDAFGNTLLVHPDAQVRGTTGLAPPLPLADPFCPLGPFECGAPDLGISSFGVYAFCSIKMGRAASIFAAQPVRFNIAGRIKVGPGSSITTGTGDPLFLNVAGRRVRFSQANVIQAVVTAPDAKIKFQRGVVLQVCFCAHSNSSDEDVLLICVPEPL